MSDAIEALRREVEAMRKAGRTPGEVVLELALTQSSPEVAQAIWYCAVPRWFNLELIQALRPHRPGNLPAQALLDELLQFPFVREYAPFGYVYQQATRRSLLERWRHANASSFIAWNRRAQRYFDRRLQTTTTTRLQASPEQHIAVLPEADRSLFERERMYHQLVVNPETGFQEFQDLFRVAERNRQYSQMQALLTEVQTQAPYLSDYRRIYLEYYAGVLALHSERSDDARQVFEGLLPKTGPSHLQSKLFYRMGEVAVMENQPDDGIRWFQRSLEICRQTHCHPWETARVLRALGSAYQDLQNWRQAEHHYRLSLEEWRRSGDELGIVETYNDLGTLHLNQHKPGKALRCYQESLNRLQNSPDQWRIARIYNNLGNYYAAQRQWSRALEHFQRSLEVKTRLGDTYGVGATHYNLANVYLDQGRGQGPTRPLTRKAETLFRQAAEHYQLSLGSFRLVGDRPVIARTLYYLASTYRVLGERDNALRCIEEAVALYRSLGSEDLARAEELKAKVIAGA